jgi:hypothetical protein
LLTHFEVTATVRFNLLVHEPPRIEFSILNFEFPPTHPCYTLRGWAGGN